MRTHPKAGDGDEVGVARFRLWEAAASERSRGRGRDPEAVSLQEKEGDIMTLRRRCQCIEALEQEPRKQRKVVVNLTYDIIFVEIKWRRFLILDVYSHVSVVLHSFLKCSRNRPSPRESNSPTETSCA